MLELILLGCFAAALLACVGLGLSILYAMAVGLVLFGGYGLYRGNPLPAVVKMAASGVKTVKNILLIFIYIGLITVVWRACGTIPFVVYHAVKLCTPGVMVLVTFLLCCAISVLTGTAFGTAATVGVICATMAGSMGIPPVFTGGAVVAGSYFGDRCSPMSTSALLVSELTGTSIYKNIVGMVKTAAVPFALTCGVYLAMGLAGSHTAGSADLQEVFARSFNLHPVTFLPAVVIIIMSLLRTGVKKTMAVSIAVGAVIAVAVQGVPVGDLARMAVLGYKPADPQLAALLSGGGIVSMVRVFCIILMSSCYAGIFEGTGFLAGIQTQLEAVSRRLSPFGCIFVTSCVSAMVACNQTLTIMLTHQLCQTVEPDRQKLAIHLENTAVLIPCLVPWSIAGTVPLASVGAPNLGLAFGVYLWILPLWNLFVESRRAKKANPA